ncbi:MAG: hydrogen peroxide-inducible genes activator [Nitrospina sp.]|nr:hydrogen peroxide-inducible genes activator [Nitrospina sp.]MBT5631710.1 hydrogen peroxide-inducible genes activator [Nitrospina sp.]
MTYTQLSYLASLARNRHFGLAARECHVTQPTLSMQIHKLEEDLGVLLFDRSKKPVQPTEIGFKIIEQAEKALLEVSRIENLAHENKGEIRGEFKLGVIPTLAPYLLPLFLESFIQNHPKVELVIEELQTAQIIQRLKLDSLDGGILATPLKHKGILEQPLFYEPFVVYLSPMHPLLKKNMITEKELSREDIWLLNEGHCFRDQAIEICKKQVSKKSMRKKLIFESGNLETLKRLVDSKFGYTLIPYLALEGMKAKKKKLRFFKPPVPTREVSLVHSRVHLKSNILLALKNSIQSSLPDELKQKILKRNLIGLPPQTST